MLRHLSLAIRCFGLLSGALIGAPQAWAQIEVRIDPRIELFSILSRLAEYPEYSAQPARKFPYDEAIEKHFRAYRNHEAVKIARELNQSHEISWNAPLSLAITLDEDPGSLKERVDLAKSQPDFDPRWKAAEARRFVAAVRAFAVDSHFAEFLRDQQEFYNEVRSRLAKSVNSAVDSAWFDNFYGFRKGDRFVVVPGMISVASYGVAVQLPSGQREVFAVSKVVTLDDKGIPAFNENSGVTSLVVHELNHGFVNPYTRRHEKEFAGMGSALLNAAKAQMASIAYEAPQIVLDESIVRAASCRYTLKHSGQAAAENCIQLQQYEYFYWTPQVYAVLGEYEDGRDKYKSLEEFTPTLASKLSQVGARAASLRSAYESTGPRIVSTVPENGSAAVSPTRAEITIAFDQPMRTSFGPGPPWQAMFDFVKSAKFDPSGKVLTLQVQLESDKKYVMKLNSVAEGNTRLRAAGGRFMAPLEFSFRTAKAAEK